MSQEPSNDKHILREIEGGRYRQYFLIYNRKSTDDTETQKNSIKYQKAENMRFAHRMHLPVAPLTLDGMATEGVISEKHSGFTEDVELAFGKDDTVKYRVERPKFRRMVEWLSKGYFRGVIFLCWDRASRNKGDDTILRKLMKAGVDIRFALAQYDKTSAGELHMDIDGMFAEHHSRVTREKVTITMRSKREQGICTYRAPVGYLNPGRMEEKPFDPERAPIIREVYKKAATGDWSMRDLARWAASQGLTMPALRRRRTKKEILAEDEDDIRLKIEPVARPVEYFNIQRILTNPFYTGKVFGNGGVWVESASHAPLVSEELFRKVQEQIKRRRTSAHYIDRLPHPLRHTIYCGFCGRVYTPFTQRAIVFYGARCKTDCTNPRRSINFTFITTKVGELIENLSFTEQELEQINARASTDIALLEAKRLSEMENAERRKKKIREDLAYLRTNRLLLLRTGAYTAEALVEEETRLTLELDALCQAEQVSDVSMSDTIKDVVKLSELLENGSAYYYLANPEKKEQIIKIIFSELRLSGNTLEYMCKNGFQALGSRFGALGAPKEGLSEAARSCLLGSSDDTVAWLSRLPTHRGDVLSSMTELASLLGSA